MLMKNIQKSFLYETALETITILYTFWTILDVIK